MLLYFSFEYTQAQRYKYKVNVKNVLFVLYEILLYTTMKPASKTIYKPTTSYYNIPSYIFNVDLRNVSLCKRSFVCFVNICIQKVQLVSCYLYNVHVINQKIYSKLKKS